ncbi:hypothetical protein TNIN_167741 [Trichonephila inaurata madagascariensis]|uniref:Uncharacterized protein n=1 Tax=Trichonephila inaurata madagascariensis TaxID=2747483 RepID=A0A8X6IUA5_9ARAC|nr:hypothetical protein TNIN_167741 [Trichonephila inaurata madagascariensis]
MQNVQFSQFTKKTVRGDGIHEGTIYRIPSGGDQEHIQMNSRHSSPEFISVRKGRTAIADESAWSHNGLA